MPDLLLELFSEEIPARMQAQASDDLRRLVTDALVARGLAYEGAVAFATPRRLALHIAGLPARQPDTREERKGPRVGAPDAALQGFLKSAGLASIDQARVEKDPKGKGEFYVAVIERAGRATTDVLADILPPILREFPWPKSMRWGAASAQPGALNWVRPLHSILCTFGPETEEPEIVRFVVGDVASANLSHGHRFMAPGAFKVRRFDDYVPALEKAKVVLDPARRRDIILHDARDIAHAQGLELVEDDALLHEVAGLVEWPVVLMGAFETEFLDIPAEVIRATIRANQKCFVLKNAATGALANRFILVSNIEASDGGKAIAAGNGRVVRARLSDALYFWQTDQAPLPDAALYTDAAQKLGLDLGKTLDQRMGKLAHLNVVFHEKLGTQGERVARIAALAQEIAPLVGADPALARRAAVLAKADLATEVVGEFPETQGLMGARYASLQGEHADVCAAIEEHYKPQGPGDRTPTNPVSIAVALADKLDTLVGFWAIDEKPTGSKDPYALRRAALGVIRIVLENGIRLPLLSITERHRHEFPFIHTDAVGDKFGHLSGSVLFNALASECATDLLAFIHDRLKIYLRDQGARHDLIDAALVVQPSSGPACHLLPQAGEGTHAAPSSPASATRGSSPLPLAGEGGAHSATGEGRSASGADDLLMVVRRVDALAAFLDTDDGRNLLAGYKRAANIVRAEAKKEKDTSAFDYDYVARADAPAQEQALASAVATAAQNAAASIAREDFAGAMAALSLLRAPVDAFFDKVTVNDADAEVRLNRLRLLNALRNAVHTVADFSKIAG